MSCKNCNSSTKCRVSCGKLSVFDWLNDVELPNGIRPYEFSEIEFKNARKKFFHNNNIRVSKGDLVVVETGYGYDIGMVSLEGETAKIQHKKKHKTTFPQNQINKILRYPSNREIELWKEAYSQENRIRKETIELVRKFNLNIKISNVEFQADKKKLYFYFVADGRIDFRELVKELVKKYRVKIEMIQIWQRQEASMIGGIGSCGRELCCSTWLTDFRIVSESAARYQQLSINSEKLLGRCGKLKCCINYELEAYTEEFKKFPSTKIKLRTKKGTAVFKKLDVFKNLMWYVYEEDFQTYIKLLVEDVKEIIELNNNKKIPENLENYQSVEQADSSLALGDIVEQNALNRFDKKFRNERKGRKRFKN